MITGKRTACGVASVIFDDSFSVLSLSSWTTPPMTTDCSSAKSSRTLTKAPLPLMAVRGSKTRLLPSMKSPPRCVAVYDIDMSRDAYEEGVKIESSPFKTNLSPGLSVPSPNVTTEIFSGLGKSASPLFMFLSTTKFDSSRLSMWMTVLLATSS